MDSEDSFADSKFDDFMDIREYCYVFSLATLSTRSRYDMTNGVLIFSFDFY